MLSVDEVRWYVPEGCGGWKGEGGLPPGWGDPDAPCDGGVYPGRHPLQRLRRVKVPSDGRSVRGVILGDHFQGIWSHWQNRLVIPCLCDQSACLKCRRDSHPRPLGYLHVWQPCQYPTLLEVPASVVYRNPAYFGRDAALRSWGFIARKLVGQPGQPVLFERTDEGSWTGDTRELPAPVDVRPVILRLLAER